MFARKTLSVTVTENLRDAQRKLLEAEAAQEYADAMVGYYRTQIKRLSSMEAAMPIGAMHMANPKPPK